MGVTEFACAVFLEGGGGVEVFVTGRALIVVATEDHLSSLSPHPRKSPPMNTKRKTPPVERIS
jgi:hypothetical protein